MNTRTETVPPIPAGISGNRAAGPTDLARLGEEVRALEAEAGVSNARTLECYRQAGEILRRLRREIATGWEAWVREHTGLTPQTASGRMRLARRWKRVARALAADPHLSYRRALALVADPRPKAGVKAANPSGGGSAIAAPTESSQAGTRSRESAVAERPVVRVPAVRFLEALMERGLIKSADAIIEVLSAFGVEVHP